MITKISNCMYVMSFSIFPFHLLSYQPIASSLNNHNRKFSNHFKNVRLFP